MKMSYWRDNDSETYLKKGQMLKHKFNEWQETCCKQKL